MVRRLSIGLWLNPASLCYHAGMERQDLLKRITTNPKIFGGAPIIKGTRVLVSSVLNRLADGEPIDEVIRDFVTITKDDILACLTFAAASSPPKGSRA